MILHDIMRKPNSIIVLLYIFTSFILRNGSEAFSHFVSEENTPRGLDVELDMINAISAADIAFIMSHSQAIVN